MNNLANLPERQQQTLIQLYEILIKYKKLFLTIFSLTAVLGIYLSMVKTPKYEYSQTFEVSYYSTINKTYSIPENKPVVEIQELIPQIYSIYLPGAIKKYKIKHPGLKINLDSKNFTISTVPAYIENQRTKENCIYFVISANGTLRNRKAYQEIFQTVGKKVAMQTNKTALQQHQYLLRAGEFREMKLLLNSLHKTKPISKLNVSVNPIGPSKELMIAFSMMAAIILAILSTFIAEFLKRIGLIIRDKQL